MCGEKVVISICKLLQPVQREETSKEGHTPPPINPPDPLKASKPIFLKGVLSQKNRSKKCDCLQEEWIKGDVAAVVIGHRHVKVFCTPSKSINATAAAAWLT